MSNSNTLLLAIGGQVAARLSRTARDLLLVYDGEYRSRSEATPLSASMPLSAPEYRGAVVENWLWGLLPDNDDVVRRWAREFDVSASSVFDLLATPVGEDCAGAVQFALPERAADVFERPGQISWLTEGDVADRLRALRRDSTAWLGEDFSGQFSLAGAQPKTALHFDGHRWGVPSGALATTHILKPAIEAFDDHDLNEHVCLDAASRAGLVAARTRVERFEDQSAIVIERYDRRWINRELRRVHQEDACQALGRHPRQKYEADGGPGVAEIASLLRDVMPAAPALSAVERFVDALIWNWIIAGPDAHAKNYSLLLSGDQVRLAPLYDVASVLPYRDVQLQKVKLAMKLGGDYRLRAQLRDTWRKVANEIDLNADHVAERVAHLVDVAPQAFGEAAADQSVVQLGSELPGRLVEAVIKRATWCRGQLPNDM